MLSILSKRNIAVLLLLIPCALVHAQKPYVISYAEHQGIKKHYVPLVAAAYRQIGIVPTFEQVNDQRALWLLNQGNLDADTVKIKDSIAKYKNIRVIPESISVIEILLICQPDIKCSPSLFANKEKTLGVVAADEFYDKQLKDAQIQVKSVTSFPQLHKMFRYARVDAIVTVLDKYSKEDFGEIDNFYKLEEKVGFHLVNKKHQALIESLEAAFKFISDNPHLIDPKDAID